MQTTVPVRRLASVVVLSLGAAWAAAVPAGAAAVDPPPGRTAPPVTTDPAGPPSPVAVARPLQAAGEATALVASVGDGHVAWVTQGLTGRQPAVLWTLQDGAPRRVATLPGVTESGVDTLEVGTARGGTPVVVVQTRSEAGTRAFRLVRLDTGAVRRVPSVRRGLSVGGMALDRGRLYWTLPANTRTAAGRTSLWRAMLAGTTIGRSTLVRRATVRHEAFGRVVADRGRIAVEAETPGRAGTTFRWRFGTPRGAWRSATSSLATDSGYQRVDAAGFTADRAGFVTVQEREDAGPLATRWPLAGGARRTALLGTEGQTFLRIPAYDPATGEVLTRGLDAMGAEAIGWTRVLFP